MTLSIMTPVLLSWAPFILSVANKPYMLIVIMLSVIMLNVVAPWQILTLAFPKVGATTHSITSLSIMTLRIMPFSITKNTTLNIITFVIMTLNAYSVSTRHTERNDRVSHLSPLCWVSFAECQYAHYDYAECHGTPRWPMQVQCCRNRSWFHIKSPM